MVKTAELRDFDDRAMIHDLVASKNSIGTQSSG
jgi:hypothetical protein